MSVPILYKETNGGWYAKWTDGRRSKRKSMSTKDEAAAKARFAQWLLIDGQAPDSHETAAYTVGELWKVYFDRRSSALASERTAVNSWKLLQPHFENVAAADVVDEVPRYISGRRRGVRGRRPVKDSTIRRELVALRACLNWCSNPRVHKAPLIPLIPPFEMPEEGQPRDRWLTGDEVTALFAAADASADDKRVGLFLRVALSTAGRKQAVLDLTWDRVDFETRVIHLHDPDQRVTKKRRASVPISASLLPVLRDAHAARKNDLVFGHRGFDAYHPVRRVAKAAGLQKVTPNVLRHTAATHMARAGVPLWKIAKVLGNSLAMVEKVYAKHVPDDLREAVDLIGGK